jgi:plastocyanin
MLDRFRCQEEAEMQGRNFRRLVTLAAMAAGAACGGSSGGSSSGPVIAISPTAGGGQTGTVGEDLGQMLKATVTEDGAPKASATVDWSSTATGAAFVPTSSITDANGVAQTLWTLGTVAGTQTATAKVSGTNKAVTFSATATADAPVAFTKVAGDNQGQEANQAFSTVLSAKVADQYGNGVGSITVNWAVTSGTATVSNPTSQTNAQGVASMGVTAGATLGAVTVEATTAAVAATTLTYHLSVVPPPIQISVGNPAYYRSDVNASQNPANDNIVVGQSVIWHWVDVGFHGVRSTHSPTFPSEVGTQSSGTYRVTFTAPGIYQYDCSVHGLQMTGNITVTP